MEQAIDIQCVAANGTTVKVCGLVDALIVVGTSSAVHTFYVARDLADPLLLGMDILKKLDVVIHCGSGELSINGERLEFCHPEDVITKRQLSCPPQTESFFSIRRVATAEPQLFEPVELNGLELAPSLFMPCQGVPVRMVNRTDEEVLIPAGTVLGQRGELKPSEMVMPVQDGGSADMSAREVSSVEHGTLQAPAEQQESGSWSGAHHCPTDQDARITTGTCQLPRVEHLPEPYQSQFQELLVEYRDVFSRTSDDIGQYTGSKVMSIDTGEAKPICQRAYRTPLHLRDKLKDKLEGMLH